MLPILIATLVIAAGSYFLSKPFPGLVPALLLALTAIERNLPYLGIREEQMVVLKPLLTILVILPWLWKQGGARLPAPSRATILTWFLLLLFWSAITSVHAFDRVQCALAILKFVNGFLILIVFYTYFTKAKGASPVFQLAVILCLLVSFLGILQMAVIHFQKFSFLEPYIVPPRYQYASRLGHVVTGSSFIRISGPFSHPNIFAEYLLYLIFLTVVGYAHFKGNTRWRFLCVTAVALSLTALVGCSSRSILGGMILGTGIGLFRVDRQRFIKGTLVAGLFLGLFLLVFAGNERIENYWRWGAGYSDREIIWKKGMEFFAKSPLVGYGLDNFPYLYMADGLPIGDSWYLLLENLAEIKNRGMIGDRLTGINPHNAYIASLLDMGVFGLVFFGTFFIHFFHQVDRLSSRQSVPVIPCEGLLMGAYTALPMALLFTGVFSHFIFFKSYHAVVLLPVSLAYLYFLNERHGLAESTHE